MNAHNVQEYRDAGPTGSVDLGGARAPPAERVERRSVRIRLDSSTDHHCDGCGGEIGERTRYRNVTVREDDGGVSEYSFCNCDCLSARFPKLE